MDYEWVGKTIYKKIQSKKIKNSKDQSEIAVCEQKTTSEKASFCSNTVYSLFFKIRANIFHAAKPLDFSLLFLCRRDSKSLLPILKMCEQILKKDSAPTQFKFFEL